MLQTENNIHFLLKEKKFQDVLNIIENTLNKEKINNSIIKEINNFFIESFFESLSSIKKNSSFSIKQIQDNIFSYCNIFDIIQNTEKYPVFSKIFNNKIFYQIIQNYLEIYKKENIEYSEGLESFSYLSGFYFIPFIIFEYVNRNNKEEILEYLNRIAEKIKKNNNTKDLLEYLNIVNQIISYLHILKKITDDEFENIFFKFLNIISEKKEILNPYDNRIKEVNTFYLDNFLQLKNPELGKIVFNKKIFADKQEIIKYLKKMFIKAEEIREIIKNSKKYEFIFNNFLSSEFKKDSFRFSDREKERKKNINEIIEILDSYNIFLDKIYKNSISLSEFNNLLETEFTAFNKLSTMILTNRLIHTNLNTIYMFLNQVHFFNINSKSVQNFKEITENSVKNFMHLVLEYLTSDFYVRMDISNIFKHKRYFNAISDEYEAVKKYKKNKELFLFFNFVINRNNIIEYLVSLKNKKINFFLFSVNKYPFFKEFKIFLPKEKTDRLHTNIFNFSFLFFINEINNQDYLFKCEKLNHSSSILFSDRDENKIKNINDNFLLEKIKEENYLFNIVILRNILMFSLFELYTDKQIFTVIEYIFKEYNGLIDSFIEILNKSFLSSVKKNFYKEKNMEYFIFILSDLKQFLKRNKYSIYIILYNLISDENIFSDEKKRKNIKNLFSIIIDIDFNGVLYTDKDDYFPLFVSNSVNKIYQEIIYEKGILFFDRHLINQKKDDINKIESLKIIEDIRKRIPIAEKIEDKKFLKKIIAYSPNNIFFGFYIYNNNFKDIKKKIEYSNFYNLYKVLKT